MRRPTITALFFDGPNDHPDGTARDIELWFDGPRENWQMPNIKTDWMDLERGKRTPTGAYRADGDVIGGRPVYRWRGLV